MFVQQLQVINRRQTTSREGECFPWSYAAMPLLLRAPGEHRAPGAKITAEQDLIELKKWTAEGKARGERHGGVDQ